MSYEPITLAEHPETDTLAFGPVQVSQLLVLRGGVEAARYHVRDAVIAGPGLLLGQDSYGVSRLALDLRADPLPAELTPAPKWLSAMRDAQVGLAYSNPRYTLHIKKDAAIHTGTRVLTGLMLMGLDGHVEAHWGEVAEAMGERIYPPGEAAGRHTPKEPLAHVFPRIYLASDGETWVMLGTNQLVVGRAGETRFARWWENGGACKRGLFDEARGRFWWSASHHLVAVDLEQGQIVASWDGHHEGAVKALRRVDGQYGMHPQPARLLSAPFLHGEELLIVACPAIEGRLPYGVPALLRVARLSPETGAFLGWHEGLGPQRSAADSCGLAQLADGSLIWLFGDRPPLVLPAEGVTRRSTPDLHVVGDPLPAHIPEPDAPWYDAELGQVGLASPENLPKLSPEGRRSLVRYLLETGHGGPAFDDLLDLDAEAFLPWADALLGLEDTHLLALLQRHPRLPEAARGASDTAVNALLPRMQSGPAREARFRLLCGVGTPAALAALAEPARGERRLRHLAEAQQLHVPETGPAEPRFGPVTGRVLAKSFAFNRPPPELPALGSGRPWALWAQEGRGRGCAAPLVEVVSVPTPALPGIESLPLFASHCSACGEVNTRLYRYTLPEGRLSLRVEAPPRCPGRAEEPEEALLLLSPPVPPDAPPWEPVGQLGGLPRWLQDAEPPDCEACGRLMFFVAQVNASEARRDVADLRLYAFWCEACGQGAQVTQRT
ncbi:MAG: hypothetical protein H6741_34390 [Alphaproteobacteria bacterium]|nr:hypothetical protein [Alphaproteobacteria bacterium]MCB9797797.1 hypothetical protein [Alphaproteobacteria bacterium]